MLQIRAIEWRHYHLWTLLPALLLECVGILCKATAPNNGVNDLAAFAACGALTVASAFVVIANFSVFENLISCRISTGTHLLEALQCFSSLLPTVGIAPVVLYCLGFLDVSDASMNLARQNGVSDSLGYERGSLTILAAHIVELVCISLFFMALAAAAIICANESSRTNRMIDTHFALFAAGTVNAIQLGQAVWRIVSWRFADKGGIDGLATVMDGPLFWLLEVLPTILGLSMLCQDQRESTHAESALADAKSLPRPDQDTTSSAELEKGTQTHNFGLALGLAQG